MERLEEEGGWGRGWKKKTKPLLLPLHRRFSPSVLLLTMILCLAMAESTKACAIVSLI